MTSVKEFFANLLRPADKLSPKEEAHYKSMIRVFFNGVKDENGSTYIPSKGCCNLDTLGITNLHFKNLKGKIILTITLERPGLLIGKSGSIIRKLVEYLSIDKPVEIKIIESKLWW